MCGPPPGPGRDDQFLGAIAVEVPRRHIHTPLEGADLEPRRLLSAVMVNDLYPGGNLSLERPQGICCRFFNFSLSAVAARRSTGPFEAFDIGRCRLLCSGRMLRIPFQPVLCLLVFVQAIGLCRCLGAEAVEARYEAAAQVAGDLAGSPDQHQDRPAEQVGCNTKVSVKTSGEQSHLFVALLTPTLVEVLPPPSCTFALSAEPALAAALPHQGRSLPLLI